MSRLCALSVDLDEIHHYFSIHAERPPATESLRAVYEVALPRFGAFARGEALPLTLFAVGSDVADDENAAHLAQMAREGHEIANHTLSHRYDFSRLPYPELKREIAQCNELLERRVGVRPTGFRAPGYVVTDAVYRALAECEMLYGSSVFPCPTYYFAKLAALGLIRLRGGHSASVVDRPWVLGAPTRPYRVGRPYWRRGGGLVELPIQVTSTLRLPIIGTTLSMLGPRMAARLAAGVVGQPLVNLELHGVDLLDARDGLTALAARQKDLRIPKERKLGALRAFTSTLREAGYRFVLLRDAATQCAGGALRGSGGR